MVEEEICEHHVRDRSRRVQPVEHLGRDTFHGPMKRGEGAARFGGHKILPVEQCDFRLQPEERSATRQSQHQSTVARAEFDQPQSS